MLEPEQNPPRRLATVPELRARGTIKFDYRLEGIRREGFLAFFEDQVVCYENVCRHVPITLDYGDGRFFTPNGRNFVCQTHRATYEPLTGKCIAGPCAGAALKKIGVLVRAGEIWLNHPDAV